MSIYTKPLAQITSADLQELLDDAAVENVRLEFKSQAPSKDEMLKKLSSFANTFGGFLVVGASAASADGRIQDLQGVAEISNYKQTIVQWCFDGVAPPLTVEVSDAIPVPSGIGKVCYVIYVPESDLTPHFLNGRKGVYVRTDEFSARFEARFANENELRHLTDRRQIIRDRRASIVSRAIRRFEGSFGIHLTGLLEFFIIPRFPARQLSEQGDLKQHILKTYANCRQVLFPNLSAGVISQQESAIVIDKNRTSMVEVNIWGMVFYRTLIGDSQNSFQEFSINVHAFVGHILLFVHHSAQVLKQLGYSGSILVETGLLGIHRMPWLHSEAGFTHKEDGCELDSNVHFRLLSNSQELARHKLVAEIVRYMLFSVNCADMVDTEEKVKRLIQTGYQFNLWAVPTDIQI